MKYIEMSEEQTQQVVDLIDQQIRKPARAVVNSEWAFVTSRIGREISNDLGRELWSWGCSDPTAYNSHIVDGRILDAYKRLQAIEPNYQLSSRWLGT